MTVEHPFGHKIRPRHCERRAVVYVRQSSQQQVLSNRESADLQYQLRQRAVQFGWPAERVQVIDDDQGLSGASAENRPGFQRLLAEISLGHVGIVFGREMSRLARSCRDWHQLLEVCAVFQVLLADADGIYDPSDFNDRLLLGLKGTMSEAELHVLKTRLHQGKLNKARRGELFTCVPIGYMRTDRGVDFDPDEQVRSVVSRIFTRFVDLGSVPRVHAEMVAQGIRLGRRLHQGPDKGRLVWQRPRRETLYEMLRHPFYAGAYTYGRTSGDPTRRTHSSAKARRGVEVGNWLCLLRDKVPAYISWEQYETNRRRLAENDRGCGAQATTGRSTTLLNGRVRCGRCGKPMAARNTSARTSPRYACDTEFQSYGAPRCQSVAAMAVDQWVESMILTAMEPASLALSLQAAEGIEADRIRLHHHWDQRRERANYEALRARKQYDAVDPENRLVARELERQWNEKLAEHERLEEDYHRFQAEQPRHLTATERQQIEALAADLPGLWQAPTTTGADRRTIVRLLIERVEIHRRGTGEQIRVSLHWRGGTVSQQDIHQRVRSYDSLERFASLRTRLLELRGEGLTGDAIAVMLQHEGYRLARGTQVTGHVVRQLLVKFGQSGIPAGVGDPSDLPGKAEWWLPDLARKLAVKPIIVHRWRWNGWLQARQLRGTSGRWIVTADAEELQRFRDLRNYEMNHRGHTPPDTLTQPIVGDTKTNPTTTAPTGGN